MEVRRNGRYTDLPQVEAQVPRARIRHLREARVPNSPDPARAYADSNIPLDEVADEAVSAQWGAGKSVRRSINDWQV